MSIEFRCPGCQAELVAEVPNEELPCPACSRLVKVPDPAHRTPAARRTIEVRVPAAGTSAAAMQTSLDLLVQHAAKQSRLLESLHSYVVTFIVMGFIYAIIVLLASFAADIVKLCGGSRPRQVETIRYTLPPL